MWSAKIALAAAVAAGGVSHLAADVLVSETHNAGKDTGLEGFCMQRVDFGIGEIAPPEMTRRHRLSRAFPSSWFVAMLGKLLLDASRDQEHRMAGGVAPVGRPFGWRVGFDHGVEPEAVAAQSVDVGGQHPVVRTDLTSQ